MAITKIGTPELFDFSLLNTALQLPTGTTLQRPSTPSTGEWRFNTDEKYVEYWDGGAWRQIDTEALPNPDDFPTEHFNVNTYFGTDVSHKIDAKFVEAANFNGSSSLIALPDSSVISQQNNFTLSFWVKPNGFVAFGTVLTLFSDYRNYVDIRTSGILTFNATGSSVDTPSSSITDGVWQHIAITKSSTAGTVIYVNGTDVVTDASDTGNASDFTASGYPNTVGAYKLTGSASDFFPGAIDQIRIFNTALTAAQAEDLYTDETTTTAATLNFPAGAGCIAAYQLDGDASDISGTYGGVTTDVGYTGLRFQPDFVWIKRRSTTESSALYDSVRGINKQLESNSDAQEAINTAPFEGFTSFDTNGFTVDNNGGTNRAPNSYVAWSWKASGAPTTDNVAGVGNVPTSGSVKVDDADSTAALTGTIVAKKISANTKGGFSIVQYDGTGTAGTIDHLLGAVPNLILVKRTDSSGNWIVGSTEVDSNSWTKILQLDLTDQEATYTGFNDTPPTSSVFSLGSNSPVNNSSGNYIAYCFANISSYQKIGSYTGTGSDTGNYIYTDSNGDGTGTGAFEPGFLLVKRTDVAADWFLYDNKRVYGSEAPANPLDGELRASSNVAEDDYAGYNFYSNGFEVANNGTNMNAAGGNYIYLAIAANKDSSVPTAANSFSPTLYTGTGSSLNVFTPNKPNFTWIKGRDTVDFHSLFDNLRGAQVLSSDSQAAQASFSGFTLDPNGFTVPTSGQVNGSSDTYVSWNWTAGGPGTLNKDGATPSVVSANAAAGFSVVKYVGPAGNSTVGHGLGVQPRMIIQKQYTATTDWYVYFPENVIDANYNYMELNDTAGIATTSSTNPTTTIINTAASGPIVAYCFADVTNYMKIDKYTGSGVSGKQVTGLGFDPSFVMIKSTGVESWYMFDNARVSGVYSDQLIANSSAAEQTGLYVDFITDGFQLDTTGSGINNGSTDYLYIAIK